MKVIERIYQGTQSQPSQDLALLLLRLCAGGLMVLNHGWAKLMNFAELSEKFPDPLGIGSSKISLILALGGEVVGASLIVVGLFTRLAALPAFITMAVAAFVVHANDPLKDKELALMFAVAYLVVLVKGPGSFSLDKLFGRI